MTTKPRVPKLYSLFYRERKQGAKWLRCEGSGAYRIETARRLFQDRLISSAFSSGPELRLRPIKGQTPDRVPSSQVLCQSCTDHHHAQCTAGSCACMCQSFRKGGQ